MKRKKISFDPIAVLLNAFFTRIAIISMK